MPMIASAFQGNLHSSKDERHSRSIEVHCRRRRLQSGDPGVCGPMAPTQSDSEPKRGISALQDI